MEEAGGVRTGGPSVERPSVQANGLALVLPKYALPSGKEPPQDIIIPRAECIDYGCNYLGPVRLLAADARPNRNGSGEQASERNLGTRIRGLYSYIGYMNERFEQYAAT